MSRLFVVCWGMLIIARIGAAGFTCPGVGDFPDPSDCKVIHKCKSRGAESNDFLCPPGTIFDQKCVWPHATRRRCDSDESEGASKSGDQEDGEIPSPSRSLFGGENSEPRGPTAKEPVEKSVKEELTNDISFNATDEVIAGDKSTEMDASLTESGLNADLDAAEKTKVKSGVEPQAKMKSVFVSSRGFDVTNTMPAGNAQSNDNAESPPPDIPGVGGDLFRGHLTNGAGRNPIMEDAAKCLPDLESKVLDDNNEEPVNDKGFEDRIQGDAQPTRDNSQIATIDDPLGDFRKCLDRLFAAVSVLFERLQYRVQSARMEGSRMLNDMSSTVDQHVNNVKAIVVDGLESRRALMNEAIEQRKAEVNKLVDQGKETVTKTMDMGRGLTVAVIEAGLGITSDLVATGKCLTNELLGAGQALSTSVNSAGRALADEVKASAIPFIKSPIQFLRGTRNRILLATSRQLRSMASAIDNLTY